MLKLNTKRDKIFVIVLAVILLAIILYLGRDFVFTGRVTENCYEVEECFNVTVENCTEVCEMECENVTTEECEIIVNNVCEEVCSEVGNETVCEEECSDVEEEVCENVTTEVCEEVCREVNCTDVVVQNCTTTLVCEEVNVTNETGIEENVSGGDSGLEEPVGGEPALEEESPVEQVDSVPVITTQEAIVLSDSEKAEIKIKTGENSVSVTKAERIGDKVSIRFEIGKYWVEKIYDYSLTSSELSEKMEYDRLKFLKKIANIKPRESGVKMEEYLGEYGI